MALMAVLPAPAVTRNCLPLRVPVPVAERGSRVAMIQATAITVIVRVISISVIGIVIAVYTIILTGIMMMTS
ncbi:hypothetical protein GCM10027514_25600 [Azotobacter armeniacus]